MKKILQTILILLFSQIVSAQTAGSMIDNARKVLDDLQHSRGGQVYEQMNGEMRSSITAPQLNSLWIGLVMQLGPCSQVTDWKSQPMGNSQVVTSRLHFEKQTLVFQLSFYDGKISGLWFRPDQEAPKTSLKPASDEAFEEREVVVVTGKYELPGFLTLPAGGTNSPCVVLVHGSGATDRNETVGENRPFEDLAHALARQGIATLRYDKRAYVYGAQSVPQGQQLNLDNEVTEDALLAVRLAGTQKEVDPNRIFLLGHSLGAMMAPRIAAACPELRGIVMMAAPARTFEDVVIDQVVYLSGLNLAPGMDPVQLRKQFENVKKAGTPQYDSALGLPMGQPLSYWQDFNNYDQTAVAGTLTLPVFILNGEKDYQVTMEDFNLWKKELGGKKNVAFRSYPGLSHLFMQASEVPSPKDYETPRHIPDYVADDLANWIKAQK